MATQATPERRESSEQRKVIRTTVDVTPDDERDAWQADAMDVSLGGMSLRASVLPEVGDQVGVRFRDEASATVSTRAEVVWAEDRGPHAGAFGVRFVDLPPGAEKSLRRMLDRAATEDVQTGASMPPPDSRVKLLIQGMDAPLRARVRSAQGGEMVVGSDLSFLRLGDKVEIDGVGSKLSGVIDEVDVEVDPKTRVPRLILTIDLGTRKVRQAVSGVAAARVTTARSADPELPTVKVKAVREPARHMKTALVEDEVAVDLKDKKTVQRRSAQPTNVLGADEPELPKADAALSLIDEPPPGWLTQGMRGVRNAVEQVTENAGPSVRRALDAVGGLKKRVLGKADAETSLDDEGDAESAPRRGLRPQHPGSSTESEGGATASQTGARNRKVGLYAVVGLVLAAGIVAYASTSGPKVETPHPQVAVAAEGSADPNAPVADPNAQGVEPMTEGAPAPEQARRVPFNGQRSPDLAAAADSPNAMVEGSAPVIQDARVRAVRQLPPAYNRPVAARPVAARPAVAPFFAQRPPAQRVVPSAPAQHVAAAQPAAAPPQGAGRPVVFGNPSVRNGTVLRLRMDGPIAVIYGVGARGAQITLTVPGRRSLDVAAPFVSQDPRIARAAVLNSGAGASLTLSFREAAPPFAARSRGNVLELVLAPTPGTAPMRAGLRVPTVVARPRR